MTTPSINLPVPIDISRQVGVSENGSPMTPLSRGTSDASSTLSFQNQDHRMLNQLVVYKVYLEHEIVFVDSEIQALISRIPTDNRGQELSFLQLRDDLKVRYNTLQKRLVKVKELLELM